MARYVIASTTDFTTVADWKQVDSTSYMSNDTEGNNNALTTSYVTSQSWTWGSSVTVEGICVKLGQRAAGNPSNTISVAIRDSGNTSTVSGTEVTANVSDLPVCTTGLAEGGWYYFKFSSPVTVSAGTYRVGAKLSATTTAVNLWRNASSSNDWSRMLVTSTALDTLTAGDDFHITGYFDGSANPATFTPITVTLNNTGTTDFGGGSTTITTPSFTVNNGATLTLQTTASTTYQLKLSGTMVVYSGGTFRLGTVSTPLPSTSTFTLTFDNTTNVNFGLTIKNGATYTTYGASKTSWCRLNGDHSSGATTVVVTDATGWQINDEIVIGSTSPTVSQISKVTVSNVSTNTLTTGATSFAHLGTAPIIAPVGNLTRNVRIISASNLLTGYVGTQAGSVVSSYYTEYKHIGGTSASGKRGGIDIAVTSSGSADVRYCAFHNISSTLTGYPIYVASASGSNITIRHNVGCDTANGFTNVATSGVQDWDGNLMIRTTGSGQSTFVFADAGSSYKNCVANGSNSAGFALTEADDIGEFTNNEAVSCTFGAFNLVLASGTASNLKAIYGRSPLEGETGGSVIIENFETFGQTGAGVNLTSSNGFVGCNRSVFKGLTTNGSTAQATATGINVSSGAKAQAFFESCTFGEVSTGKTAHTNLITLPSSGRAYSVRMVFTDCAFNYTGSLITNQTSMTADDYIAFHNFDQTVGDHRVYTGGGTQTVDSTIQDGGNNTIRVTPIANAVLKAKSSAVLQVQVASGSTKTIGVKVRESVSGDGADYVGARLRLMCKRNPAAGIASDQVIATATASSEGAWETISGTSPAIDEDTILEFYVDGSTTSGTGWFNISEWTVS